MMAKWITLSLFLFSSLSSSYKKDVKCRQASVVVVHCEGFPNFSLTKFFGTVGIIRSKGHKFLIIVLALGLVGINCIYVLTKIYIPLDNYACHFWNLFCLNYEREGKEGQNFFAHLMKGEKSWHQQFCIETFHVKYLQNQFHTCMHGKGQWCIQDAIFQMVY